MIRKQLACMLLPKPVMEPFFPSLPLSLFLECENQTEVLFRIERETTDKSSHSEVWPYLALIYGEGSHVACHAEIVSPLWLLTTAYCLQ